MATFSSNSPVIFGNPVTVTFSSPSDPSSVDTAAGFHDSFATSAAGLAGTYAAAGSSTRSSFNFGTAGGYTLYGRIFDKDNGSTDYTTAVTVGRATTATTLTTSAAGNTISLDFPITLTAKVAETPAGATPTGSVDFFDTTTGVDLGHVNLSNGTASLTTAMLPLGAQTITASYSGDVSNLPSSTTGTVTVLVSIVALDRSAASTVDVSNGAIINIPGALVVDSSSSTALTASGSAHVTAGSILVVGNFRRTGTASLQPNPTTGALVVPDAFSGLTPPTGGTQRQPVNATSGTLTIFPGVYSRINASGTAHLIFSSGTYIILGGGLSLGQNAIASGSGVLIVNAGSNYPNRGGTYGSISVSGNAQFNLNPSTTGPYAGFVIFQTRDNSSTLSWSSNATASTGAIYAPAARLTTSNTATVMAALIVDRLSVSGTSTASHSQAVGNGIGATLAQSVNPIAPLGTTALVAGPAVAGSITTGSTSDGEAPSAAPAHLSSRLDVLDEVLSQEFASPAPASLLEPGSLATPAPAASPRPLTSRPILRRIDRIDHHRTVKATPWTTLANARLAATRLWRSGIRQRPQKSLGQAD
jgi:hypothetical protein